MKITEYHSVSVQVEAPMSEKDSVLEYLSNNGFVVHRQGPKPIIANMVDWETFVAIGYKTHTTDKER